MDKLTPIRITKNDRKEHARMVKNARAKIRRIEQKHGLENLKKSGINLREEMPTPRIDDFTTRKELNEWKEKQEDFTNRYNIDFQFHENKHGVVASRRRLRDIEQKNRREQYIARNEIEKYEGLGFTVKGEEQGTVGERASHFKEGAVMGVRVPADFDFDEVAHASRLDTVEKNMARRADSQYYSDRQIQLKKNFLTALEGSFHGEADELIELIKSVPPDDFYELWLGEADMEFSRYDSDGQEVNAGEGHIERITDYFLRYYVGDVNMDLKNF